MVWPEFGISHNESMDPSHLIPLAQAGVMDMCLTYFASTTFESNPRRIKSISKEKGSLARLN